MPSSEAFVTYAADQLSGAGEITCRKMFGDWGLYCNGKFFAMVSDGTLFFKPTPGGLELCPDWPLAPAYKGGKACIVADVDDRERLLLLAEVTCRELPEPKPRDIRRKETK